MFVESWKKKIPNSTVPTAPIPDDVCRADGDTLLCQIEQKPAQPHGDHGKGDEVVEVFLV